MPKTHDKFDECIRRVFGTESISFIQVGAFDGVQGDPIRKYIVEYNWSGILIEPQKKYFNRLVKNYAGHSGLVFENVLIHPKKKELTLHIVRKDPSCSSTNEKNRNVWRWKKKGIKRVACKATRLDKLLEKHHVPHVDLLQIDTEGDDWNVICSLNFKRYTPRIVHYEQKHLGDRKKDCADFLTRMGYDIIEDDSDVIAVLRESDGV